MEQISTIAGMIGVTVISGLAVNFGEDFYEAAVCGTGFGDRREDHFSAGDVGCHASETMLAVLYTGLMFYLIKKEKMEYIQTGYLYDHRGEILLSVIGILGIKIGKCIEDDGDV